ncbi:MAG TPA: hypothetical protein VE243_06905 [Candidatus Acidoferrum sp.]|nr:hypothetical protein [Candidatus Acidoferrum sp.]
MKRKNKKSTTKSKTTANENAETARWAEAEKLLRSARGKFHWEGDLAAMRRDRPLVNSGVLAVPKGSRLFASLKNATTKKSKN